MRGLLHETQGCGSVGRVQAGSEGSCVLQREMSRHYGQRCMAGWELWIFRGCARRWNSGSWGEP